MPRLTAPCAAAVCTRTRISSPGTAVYEQCKAAGAATVNHGKDYSCNQVLSYDMGCRIRHDLGVSQARCKELCDRHGGSGCGLSVHGVAFSMCGDCHNAQGNVQGQPPTLMTDQCERACRFQPITGSTRE